MKKKSKEVSKTKSWEHNLLKSSVSYKKKRFTKNIFNNNPEWF